MKFFGEINLRHDYNVIHCKVVKYCDKSYNFLYYVFLSCDEIRLSGGVYYFLKFSFIL